MIKSCDKILSIVKICSFIFGASQPTWGFGEKIEQVVFSFLWNKGPDRIKGKFIIKDLEKGGLRMIQIDAFIAALKVTWLRRFIMQPDSAWNSLSNIDINNISSMGENYAEIKAKELLNPILERSSKKLETSVSFGKN